MKSIDFCCPYCVNEFDYDIEDIEEFQEILTEIFANTAVVGDFVKRRVGYAELKAAAENLRRLEEKYLSEKEENDG